MERSTDENIKRKGAAHYDTTSFLEDVLLEEGYAWRLTPSEEKGADETVFTQKKELGKNGLIEDVYTITHRNGTKVEIAVRLPREDK